MSKNNSVFLKGNAGRDPELKVTTTGKNIATFSVAISKGKDKGADFFDIEGWEDVADEIMNNVKKGTCVEINGRLQRSQYPDKAVKGRMLSRVYITADSVVKSSWEKTEEDAE